MPGSIQSIERAAAVLRLLAAPPGRLSLAQIVASLQLAKGTAHGILRTLVDVGFVAQDPATGKYLLADALLELGGATYLDPNEIRARSMNWADPLAARTGQSVLVGVLARDTAGEVTVVHHVFRPDGSAQRSETGTRLPAHATALGKVLLAYSPSPGGGPLAAFTSRTVVEARALAGELRAVRAAGHAVEMEEFAPGRAAVAAPIEDTGGLVVAAVGVVGEPDALLERGRTAAPSVLARVRDCARHIAGELAQTRAELLHKRGTRAT